MATKNQKTAMVVGGVGVLALLLFAMGGKAKAAPANDNQQPIDEPPVDPPVDDVPQAEDWTSNWGGYPTKLRPLLIEAEKVSGIPGLARFLAVWSWGSFRANQPLVSTAEALAIAMANPNLCTNCHNDSPAEVKQSREALENVTPPKGKWKKPADFDAWADFGSAGLFDILAGSHAHTGVHEGFTPLISEPPTVLFDPRVSAVIATNMVYRIINGPYKVLVPGTDTSKTPADPRSTWINIRRATASPAGFQANTAANQAAGQRYAARADEIGIDLSKLGYPWPKGGIKATWPGIKAVYNALMKVKV